MKLAIVVGTRPEIIRLARIIQIAPSYFETVLIHTGQNWDPTLKDVFFDELELQQPNYYLNVVGKNLGHTMGNVISTSYDLFLEIKPDCLLILGDTNSALCAISAKRLKIPIFHMEAGNRCFDQNVPEEINRMIVDHVSDINLCYCENSRKYLLAEGAIKNHVVVTGTPLTEVLHHFGSKIDSSTILTDMELSPKEYFVLSMHREENVDNEIRFKTLINSINEIAVTFNKPIIFSTHPRTQNKLQEHGIVLHELIRSVKPMGLIDYCHLQKHAYCVISDSGSVSEESAILGFPAVSLRDSTERPEAIETGSIVLGNITADMIINSVKMSIELPTSRIPYDYQGTQVSTIVLKTIQSYTPCVNRNVWRK
jgi:UDP-N-acetyl-L-fucosamine synthase